MSQFKVAIIDDATMIRDLIKKFVRQNFPGAKIFDAHNGHAGMQLLKQQPVDLILCDWEMPELDGEGLLKWVREQDQLKKTPFIMVTSRGDKEYVVKAISSGVSDYLVKPFNNKQFLEKIHKALKRHGVQVAETLSTPPPTGRGGDSLAVLTHNTKKPAPKNNKAPTKALPKGVALVRTSEGEIKCALKKLDLKSMQGIFKQHSYMPALLEQVSLDFEFKQGEKEQVVRMNGFISELKATQDSPSCEQILISIVFMDEDPQKRALISEFVGQFK